MTEHEMYRCGVCGAPTKNTHHCLDRRVESLSVSDHDNKPATVINISERETLVMYCDDECWQLHQPDLTEAMALVQTFPAFNFVTPCCRCGKAVNRTKPYVCYSISEMCLEDDKCLTVRCIDDRDFAVLCSSCESPVPPEASETIFHSIERDKEMLV